MLVLGKIQSWTTTDKLIRFDFDLKIHWFDVNLIDKIFWKQKFVDFQNGEWHDSFPVG